MSTKEFGFRVYRDPITVGPFRMCHEPQTAEGEYVLSGHLHPAALLRAGRELLRLPCSWFGRRSAVLPSFGEFTGSAVVTPGEEDGVFVVADGQIVEVA